MKKMLALGIIVVLLISGISIIQDNTFESLKGVSCKDGIDNSGCVYVDNENANCWIYEGPIYETHPYYHDGTFEGLTEKIPEIAELGVKTIYLMPIWEQPPEEDTYSFIYHTYDYFKINQVYGTPQELKELIDTAHEYNLKVLFDLVTCCTWEGSYIWNQNGTFSISLSELQEKTDELGWTLEYYEDDDGNMYVYYNCREEGCRTRCDLAGMIVDDVVMLCHYPSAGWGFAIDKTNPDVIDYFTEVAEYYVKEYDIDGWRLDAPSNNWNPNIIDGDHSIQQLLRNVKEAITKVKPDAILLAEAPSVAKTIPPMNVSPDPVLDEMCEISYSYYFYHKLGEIIRDENPQQLICTLMDEKIWYNRTRTRFFETHDTERMNQIDPHLNKPLLVLISTIPGVPMIQAGQEIGAINAFWYNPSVDWINGDYELRGFYKKLFEIRDNNNALKYGTIENTWESGDDTFAYMREFEGEKVIAIVNFLDKQATSTLNLSFLDAGTILYDGLNNEAFMVSDPSNFGISIPAYGSRILFLREGDEPIVYFEKPKDKYLYIFDREIMPRIFGNIIILGKIIIEVDAYGEDGIDRIEFYIDDTLCFSDHDEPYSWTWDETIFGWHEIKVLAYDGKGNKVEDKTGVMIFNLGG